jgi:hypothetical protein
MAKKVTPKAKPAKVADETTPPVGPPPPKGKKKNA